MICGEKRVITLNVGQMMDKLEQEWNDELAIELARLFVENRPKVDHREQEKIKNMMIEDGWRVVEIEAGDYSMPIVEQDDIVMVERKAEDFLGGIIDKGLHLQLKRMVSEKPNAMHHLLIVDKTFTEVFGQGINRQIYPNQLLGFIGSLIAHGFYPIFTGSTNASANLLKVIQRKVFEMESSETGKPIHHKVRIGGASIVTFPNIDEKLGKALIDRFRTIENLCKQDIDTLCDVPGIGKKKAQKIYDYLHRDLSEINKVNIPKLPSFTSEKRSFPK
jgi:ERCC4-type nuclease